jgi:SsrA-binding protein
VGKPESQECKRVETLACSLTLRQEADIILINSRKPALRNPFAKRVIFIGWIRFQNVHPVKKDFAMATEGIKVVAQNRKARHDYFIEQTMEAGIVLSGTEVKSIRQGKVNLKDCYAMIVDGEVILSGMHISPYEQGNIFNKDPLRDRKLLLHKAEIQRLIGYTQQKGLTLVPLELYLKRGKVKLELGVAKGKKLYDKREDIAEREAKRDIDRKLKESLR